MRRLPSAGLAGPCLKFRPDLDRRNRTPPKFSDAPKTELPHPARMFSAGRRPGADYPPTPAGFFARLGASPRRACQAQAPRRRETRRSPGSLPSPLVRGKAIARSSRQNQNCAHPPRILPPSVAGRAGSAVPAAADFGSQARCRRRPDAPSPHPFSFPATFGWINRSRNSPSRRSRFHPFRALS